MAMVTSLLFLDLLFLKDVIKRHIWYGPSIDSMEGGGGADEKGGGAHFFKAAAHHSVTIHTNTK